MYVYIFVYITCIHPYVCIQSRPLNKHMQRLALQCYKILHIFTYKSCRTNIHTYIHTYA